MSYEYLRCMSVANCGLAGNLVITVLVYFVQLLLSLQ